MRQNMLLLRVLPQTGLRDVKKGQKCRSPPNSNPNQDVRYIWRCTLLSFFRTCRGMPWHHLRLHLPRHFPRHTTEPSTDLHGIPWKPNPIPDLGAVNIVGVMGLAVAFHGVAWRLPRKLLRYHSWDATAPPTACHGILCHAMGWDSHRMPWVLPWPFRAKFKEYNSVEPGQIFSWSAGPAIYFYNVIALTIACHHANTIPAGPEPI